MTAPRTISLGQLVGTLILRGPVNDCRADWAEVVPTGVSSDSRDVRRGDLFVAMPGERRHGATFAASAVRAGACAVVTDGSGSAAIGQVRVPVLVGDDARPLGARIAAALWGQPAEHLHTAVVTGTHGVATTANMVHRLLDVGGIDAIEVRGDHLTAPELHRRLAGRPRATDAVVALDAPALRRGAGDHLRADVVAVAALHDGGAHRLSILAGEIRTLLAQARRRIILMESDVSAGLADQFPDATLVALATSPYAHRATWVVGAVGADRAASTFTLTGPGGVRITTTVGRPGSLLLADAALAVVTAATRLEPVPVSAGVPVDVSCRMEVVGRYPTILADRATEAEEIRRVLGSLPRLGRLWCVYPADAPVERAGRLQLAQALADAADEIVLAASSAGGTALASLRACFTPAEAGRVHESVSTAAALSFARQRASRGDTVVIAGCGTMLGGREPREGTP